MLNAEEMQCSFSNKFWAGRGSQKEEKEVVFLDNSWVGFFYPIWITSSVWQNDLIHGAKSENITSKSTIGTLLHPLTQYEEQRSSQNLGEHCNSQESETKDASSSPLPSVANVCLRLNQFSRNSAGKNLVWFNINYNSNKMAAFIPASQLSSRTKRDTVTTAWRRLGFSFRK